MSVTVSTTSKTALVFEKVWIRAATTRSVLTFRILNSGHSVELPLAARIRIVRPGVFLDELYDHPGNVL
jgi:hypothetical protein